MNRETVVYTYTFRDGERIYFAEGKFDAWCVFRQPKDELPEPPKDSRYFAELLAFGERYGHERIYSNFSAVYKLADRHRRWAVFELIRTQGLELAEKDYLAYAKVMVTLYYTMIAEENRQPENRYPLKKKVKKIGVFQVLIEKMPPREAANFSRGKATQELRTLLAEYERRARLLGLE